MVLVGENVDKEDNKSEEANESKVVRCSCAQIHDIEKVEDTTVIWDSGSTIVLTKRKSILDNIKNCKATMCSNG